MSSTTSVGTASSSPNLTPTTSPCTPSTFPRIPSATRTYSILLDAAAANLQNGDEDAMNELRERVDQFIETYKHSPVNHGETETRTSEFSRSIDDPLMEMMKRVAELKTSPETAQFRAALKPFVSVRRNLLADFNTPE